MHLEQIMPHAHSFLLVVVPFLCYSQLKHNGIWITKCFMLDLLACNNMECNEIEWSDAKKKNAFWSDIACWLVWVCNL